MYTDIYNMNESCHISMRPSISASAIESSTTFVSYKVRISQVTYEHGIQFVPAQLRLACESFDESSPPRSESCHSNKYVMARTWHMIYDSWVICQGIASCHRLERESYHVNKQAIRPGVHRIYDTCHMSLVISHRSKRKSCHSNKYVLRPGALRTQETRHTTRDTCA